MLCCWLSCFAPVLQFIWFHTFMDQKYDCFNRDKKPFYWFHVSPYCILWAVSELTIFYMLIALSWFLINSKTRKRRNSEAKVSIAALCATRMKFIASNMRFHTKLSWKILFGACRIALYWWRRMKWNKENNTFFHLDCAWLQELKVDKITKRKKKKFIMRLEKLIQTTLMSFIIETSINYGENKNSIKMNSSRYRHILIAHELWLLQQICFEL